MGEIKKIFLFLFLCSPIHATTYSWDDTSVPNMVAGWHFDETSGTTVADAKSVAKSTTTGTSWVSGVYGNGINHVEGSYTLIGDDFLNLPFGASARSIGFWYKETGTHVAGGILLLYGCSTANRYFEIRQSAGAQLSWDVVSGGGNWNFTVTSSTNTNWTHLIFSYDGNQTVDLYENGNLRQSLTSANATNTQDSADRWYWIGAYAPAPSGNSIHMSLDDLAFTNTYMTSTTATNWYNGTAPVTATKKQIRRSGFMGIIE